MLHGDSLHTANLKANAKVCLAHDDQRSGLLHYEAMTEAIPTNAIREFRLRRKMTLENLAHALEPPTTKGTISQYERGERGFSLERLGEMAAVLGCTPGELLDGPRDGPTVMPTAEDLKIALAAALPLVWAKPYDEDDLLIVAQGVLAGLRRLARDPNARDPGYLKAVEQDVSDAVEAQRPSS